MSITPGVSRGTGDTHQNLAPAGRHKAVVVTPRWDQKICGTCNLRLTPGGIDVASLRDGFPVPKCPTNFYTPWKIGMPTQMKAKRNTSRMVGTESPMGKRKSLGRWRLEARSVRGHPEIDRCDSFRPNNGYGTTIHEIEFYIVRLPSGLVSTPRM